MNREGVADFSRAELPALARVPSACSRSTLTSFLDALEDPSRVEEW